MEPIKVEVIKKITLNIRKVDAWKNFKRLFNYTYNEAKEVYEHIINDDYVGLDIDDVSTLVNTLKSQDWCDVEIETTIINQNEINKFNEAQNWLNGLPEDKKEYFNIMGKYHFSMVPFA